MKILVIGSGGREHALCWKLAQGAEVEKLYCAPGNAGTAELAENLPVKAEDVDGLLKAAQEKSVDLTVVGPEVPLVAGLVDRFHEAGLNAFGPSAAAARLEGSKAFAKQVMLENSIPTAEAGIFDDYEKAQAYLEQKGAPIVVKADGLAAGKGVIVCSEEASAAAALRSVMVDRQFGEAGSKVMLEEMLEGEECSILALADGESALLLPSSQDHKRIGDGDTGLNTGGMGAYSPAPVASAELERKVLGEIVMPTIKAMGAAGSPFKGVLYVGVMVTAAGPKVLEYNVRFGDPETQVVLARLGSDLAPLLVACEEGKLGGMKIDIKDEAAVCVVAASGGYPGSYEKGRAIEGLEGLKGRQDVIVFHAGTTEQEGRTVSSGGRVLGLTALGSGIKEAQEKVYAALAGVKFEGIYYRKDIAHRAIGRK